MHLFTDDESAPHLRHFHAHHHGSSVELSWEVRNAPHLKWRVLRSKDGFAATADVPGTNAQTLVMEDEEDHLDDEGLDEHAHYHYTVFCKNEQGVWQRQAEVKVRPHDVLHWLHPREEALLASERDLVTNPEPEPRWGVPAPRVIGLYQGQDFTGELGTWLRSGD